MPLLDQLIHPSLEALGQGGLLTPAIRRDLADLNRQYLELALAPELSDDPRFAWSEVVRSSLVRSDEATLGRMSACPFALFDIQLAVARLPSSPVPFRVADGLSAAAEPWHGRCLTFAQLALFMALRLAEAAPLALRIALGLSSAAEQKLREMCPSEVAQFAACPEVVRPRWPSNPRFWAMLRCAARVDSASLLQSAHCFGICQLGPGQVTPQSQPASPRR